MKKKVGIIIFIVCVFIGIVFFKENRLSEKPAEYLIDIMIKNEEKINIGKEDGKIFLVRAFLK